MSRSRGSNRFGHGADRARFTRRSVAALAIVAAGLLAPPSVSAQDAGSATVTPSSGPIGTRVTVAGDIDPDCYSEAIVYLEIGQLGGVPTPGGEATSMLIGEGEEAEGWYTVEGTIPARIHNGRALGPGTEELHVYCRSPLGSYLWHVATVEFTITGGETPDPGGPAVTLGSSTVTAGGSVSVSASGFAPDSEVRVELHSDPIQLATLLADGAGLVEGEVVIPASVEPGEHTVVLIGTDPNGGPLELTAALTVTAAEDPAGEPQTPTDGSGTATPAPSAKPVAARPAYTG